MFGSCVSSGALFATMPTAGSWCSGEEPKPLEDPKGGRLDNDGPFETLGENLHLSDSERWEFLLTFEILASAVPGASARHSRCLSWGHSGAFGGIRGHSRPMAWGSSLFLVAVSYLRRHGNPVLQTLNIILKGNWSRRPLRRRQRRPPWTMMGHFKR